MPKKANKKVSKKEDSEDEYDVEEEQIDEDIEENDEELDEDEDDSDDEEKDELNIDGENDTNGCMIDEAIEGDDIYFDNIIETEVGEEKSSEFVSKENRVSCNRLTKYEMVRILGERIKQLNMGAKPMIKNHKGLSYEDVAIQELQLNMIPFKIKRPLPNGKFEIWTLDELYKDHLTSMIE
jgi:DNA-directed RNA polymerase subunit K/omega